MAPNWKINKTVFEKNDNFQSCIKNIKILKNVHGNQYSVASMIFQKWKKMIQIVYKRRHTQIFFS